MPNRCLCDVMRNPIRRILPHLCVWIRLLQFGDIWYFSWKNINKFRLFWPNLSNFDKFQSIFEIIFFWINLKYNRFFLSHHKGGDILIELETTLSIPPLMSETWIECFVWRVTSRENRVCNSDINWRNLYWATRACPFRLASRVLIEFWVGFGADCESFLG